MHRNGKCQLYTKEMCQYKHYLSVEWAAPFHHEFASKGVFSQASVHEVILGKLEPRCQAVPKVTIISNVIMSMYF